MSKATTFSMEYKLTILSDKFTSKESWTIYIINSKLTSGLEHYPLSPGSMPR